MFKNPTVRGRLLATLLFVATGVLILYKIVHLGYALTEVTPQEGYYLKLTMTFEGSAGNVSILVTLPHQFNGRQQIKHERRTSGNFKYTVSPGRIG